MNTYRFFSSMALILPLSAAAAVLPAPSSSTLSTLQPMPTDSVGTTDSLAFGDQEMAEVTIVRRQAGMRRMSGPLNGNVIDQQELFKAACCNLGESFTTNPSVDVNYSDAATGARQIKLLGLSGTYVQMLTENMPAFRGAATPFALGYVPGPWMKAIQVSKGSSSVKNGYESITGQINIDYLKPEDKSGATANLYTDTDSKFEANAEGNIHLGNGLTTELLTHYENRWGHHDENKDGFADMPNVRQVNLNNRWQLMKQNYILHAGIAMIDEKRTSGQTTHHVNEEMKHAMLGKELYSIGINTQRYEGFMKHAFILDHEHGTNIALIANTSMQLMDATYGHKYYDVNEKNVYGQLLLDHNFSQGHSLSAGASINYDYLSQRYTFDQTATALTDLRERETTSGIYAQYTWNMHDKIVLMAGLRADHSSLYGTFLTPRLHLKWQANDVAGFRLSAGKGYRSVHALAENHNLLASSRTMVIDDLDQEEAWNFGASSQLNIPLWGKTLKVNAEYYYTRFLNQALIDFDSNPHQVHIVNSDDLNYSHVFQLDASYEVLKGLTLTGAYRRNYVKETIDGIRLEKALQSRWKGLVAASYKTPLSLWQIDATLGLNGGGRMPRAYTLADGSQSWQERFSGYEQLNLQLTRWFRHWSIYIGGENLTGQTQKNPVVDATNPWGSQFDTNMVYGPLHGAMGYVGVRLNIGRL